MRHPLERVYEVRRRMLQLKGSYQPVIALGLLNAVGYGPRMLQEQVTNARQSANAAYQASVALSQAPPRAIGWKLWHQGQTMRVRFLDGSPAQHQRFLQIAGRWSARAPASTGSVNAASTASKR